MASTDVYQLVDVSQYGGQQMLNVYYYRQAAAVLVGDIPQQLADSFETTVLPDIVGIQTPDVLHTELRVTNLFNPSEVATSLISVPGTVAATDTDAPFVAAGFRLQQDNGAIRNGAKRVGGIPGIWGTDGIIVAPAEVALLASTAAAMALGLDAGVIVNAWLPVIVKRIQDGLNYRLPENSGEAVVGNIIDALFNPELTSQTSRKYGVGA